MSRRPRPLLLALLAVLAALLGPAAPARAQARDTLTVALTSIISTLDPHMHFERVGILVNINMFDSLLHKNTKLEYEPSLATSWKAVNDTTWEFKLRKGVRFHNGDLLTAEDVKYSFDRVLDKTKKSPQYGNIRAIKEARIVDPDTVHLVTEKPYPLLLERVVFFPIVPKKHVEKVGDQAFGESATVGTGPWKLVEYKRDQYIRLEAFDQHWRGKPAFRFLVFRGVPEIATQVAELKTGGVDIIRNVSADLVPELKAHSQTYVSSTPILRTHYVALDMRHPPFDKKLVRQAANYAIDREAIVQKMMAGLGRVVPTVVHPAAFGHDPSVTPYPYDPKKARELLAQAGHPNGVEITLHSAFVEFRPVFEAICQMLTEVGIKTNPKMWDPGPAWNKFFIGEGKATHGYYGSWGYYSVFDADAILHPLYHTEPGGWAGKWYARVEGLDQLIDQARSTVDQAARKRTYSQIQRLIKEEAPSIFLFHQFDTLGISRKVEYAARGDEWLWLFSAKPKR
ncbi:MAG TPA: ABC transporter substrate-binding protein [Candidatus Tectomicrobia bacterium]|nr:ABC transporter substrate-binding protein [Candidatus Tectomicrobia bacterium]